MGGEGSMASAILSLKQNRALVKKRKVKDLKALLYEESGKTELEFKKVSPEKLAQIKTEIRRKAKEDKLKEALFYLISTIIVLSGLYWLICI